MGEEASAKVIGKEVLKFDTHLFENQRTNLADKYIWKVLEWVGQFTKKTMQGYQIIRIWQQ